MASLDPRVERIFQYLLGGVSDAAPGDPSLVPPAALVGEEVLAIMRKTGATEADLIRWMATEASRPLAPGEDLGPLCHRIAVQSLIGTYGVDAFSPDEATALAAELLAASRGEPPPALPTLRRGGRAPGRHLPPPRR